MKKHLFTALAIVLALTACKRDVKAAAPAPGIYRGTTPCADCEGINTTLAIAADGTYSLKMVYLGRDAAPFIESGGYAWDAESGILTAGNGMKYKSEDDNLVMLDQQGNEIAGALAKRYILARVPDAPLLETEWRLVGLSGQDAVTGDHPPFITFSGKDAHVSGFAACNRFNGGYKMAKGKNITFTSMMSTKMACADSARMALEQRFLEALGHVNSYAVSGETLTLTGAEGVRMTFSAGTGG